jgi:hypothetical protein
MMKRTRISRQSVAAQMFLDSGDGVVFKGRVGPWYTGKRGHYHLSREAAEELLSKALADFRKKRDNQDPEELFIHGRTSFNDQEWAGFEAAAGNSARVVGVTIKHADDFRLYRRDGDLPVLRGLGLVRDEKYGFLATNGFIPRLQTYYGSEVPVPLSITINRGEADIQTRHGRHSCSHQAKLQLLSAFRRLARHLEVCRCGWGDSRQWSSKTAGPAPSFSTLHLDD